MGTLDSSTINMVVEYDTKYDILGKPTSRLYHLFTPSGVSFKGESNYHQGEEDANWYEATYKDRRWIVVRTSLIGTIQEFQAVLIKDCGIEANVYAQSIPVIANMIANYHDEKNIAENVRKASLESQLTPKEIKQEHIKEKHESRGIHNLAK